MCLVSGLTGYGVEQLVTKILNHAYRLVSRLQTPQCFHPLATARIVMVFAANPWLAFRAPVQRLMLHSGVAGCPKRSYPSALKMNMNVF